MLNSGQLVKVLSMKKKSIFTFIFFTWFFLSLLNHAFFAYDFNEMRSDESFTQIELQCAKYVSYGQATLFIGGTFTFILLLMKRPAAYILAVIYFILEPLALMPIAAIGPAHDFDAFIAAMLIQGFMLVLIIPWFGNLLIAALCIYYTCRLMAERKEQQFENADRL